MMREEFETFERMEYSDELVKTLIDLSRALTLDEQEQVFFRLSPYLISQNSSIDSYILCPEDYNRGCLDVLAEFIDQNVNLPLEAAFAEIYSIVKLIKEDEYKLDKNKLKTFRIFVNIQ